MISIIIRTHNEERWITPCLEAVHRQSREDYEVVLVDNESTDRTVEKARKAGIDTLVTVEDYRPGYALNEGIRASEGELIACLSGHCIPADEHWLARLAEGFSSSSVAGVYGRQEPLASTPDQDKRDMLIAFGLDRRTQEKDPFFHNANSMIRRSLWEEVPFDEQVAHIEDRVWAREMQSRDYVILYEPEARVYHYHGIHQGGDEERARGVVRVLESLDEPGADGRMLDPDLLDIVALIPIRGPSRELAGKPAVAYTVEAALESSRVDRVIVSTDDEELAEAAKEFGAEAPFVRDPMLSEDYVDLEKVIEYSLRELEERDVYPDLLVSLEATFPFRPRGLIDRMIDRCLGEGLDTVIAARRESGGIFRKDGDRVEPITTGLSPRKYREPTYVGLKGVGCVTHPEFARSGSMFGEMIGICEVDDPLASFEVRNPAQFELAEKLIGLSRAEGDAVVPDGGPFHEEAGGRG